MLASMTVEMRLMTSPFPVNSEKKEYSRLKFSSSSCSTILKYLQSFSCSSVFVNMSCRL